MSSEKNGQERRMPIMPNSRGCILVFLCMKQFLLTNVLDRCFLNRILSLLRSLSKADGSGQREHRWTSNDDVWGFGAQQKPMEVRLSLYGHGSGDVSYGWKLDGIRFKRGQLLKVTRKTHENAWTCHGEQWSKRRGERWGFNRKSFSTKSEGKWVKCDICCGENE